MIADSLELLASILWLAAGIGALGSVSFFFLIPAYGYWIEIKTGMDVEMETYELVVDAIARAETLNGYIEIRVIVADDPSTNEDS